MTKKTMMMGLFLIGLTACGGGGGGGASISGGASSINFRTLSSASNGYGVALAEDRETGEDALFYSDDIRSFVSAGNAPGSGGGGGGLDDNLTFGSFTVRSTTGNTRIREGTLTIDGITFNVEIVEDIRNTGVGDTGVLYMNVPSSNVYWIFSGGGAYSNPPTTGPYTYTGAQVTSPGASPAAGTPGSFSMTVNFSTRNFQYDGTSAGVRVVSSGDLNTSTGRFDSSIFTATESSTSYNGQMHGLLHGDGATATTGIFYTTESGSSSPRYSGAFVGSRN